MWHVLVDGPVDPLCPMQRRERVEQAHRAKCARFGAYIDQNETQSAAGKRSETRTGGLKLSLKRATGWWFCQVITLLRPTRPFMVVTPAPGHPKRTVKNTHSKNCGLSSPNTLILAFSGLVHPGGTPVEGPFRGLELVFGGPKTLSRRRAARKPPYRRGKRCSTGYKWSTWILSNVSSAA